MTAAELRDARDEGPGPASDWSGGAAGRAGEAGGGVGDGWWSGLRKLRGLMLFVKSLRSLRVCRKGMVERGGCWRV